MSDDLPALVGGFFVRRSFGARVDILLFEVRVPASFLVDHCSALTLSFDALQVIQLRLAKMTTLRRRCA